MKDSLSRSILARKLYGGIIDQTWADPTQAIIWVETVLLNDRERLKQKVQSIFEEIPASMDYETDARDIWPKRWKRMLSILNVI